jgi:hypothetical protein
MERRISLEKKEMQLYGVGEKYKLILCREKETRGRVELFEKRKE